MSYNYTFEFRLSAVTSGGVWVFNSFYTKDGFYSMLITDDQFSLIEKSLSDFNIGVIFEVHHQFNGSISDIAVYKVDPDAVFMA